MVLIAFAILFGGLGAFSLSGPSATDTASATSSTAAATSNAQTGTAQSTTSQSGGQAGAVLTAPSSTQPAGPVDKSLAVQVLNNGVVAGLARRTAQRLESAGWTGVTTGNYSSVDLSDNTVFYDDTSAQRSAATALAAQLGATVEPKSAGPHGLPRGLVVVVVTAG
jgi:hypothetical protein